MTDEEKNSRYEFCLKHVVKNTATNWAKNFIHNLHQASEPKSSLPSQPDQREDSDSLLQWFLQGGVSDLRIFVIDWDEFEDQADAVMDDLVLISKATSVTVIVTSSSSIADLEAAFKERGKIVLCPESGSIMITPTCRRSRIPGSISNRLTSYSSIKSVMELYQNLFPLCSRIEESSVHLKWSSSPEHVSAISAPICEILSSHPGIVDIVMTDTSIEVRDKEYGSSLRNVLGHVEEWKPKKILFLCENIPANACSSMEIKYAPSTHKSRVEFIHKLSKSVNGPVPSRGG
jgi:hypothetical protein